MLVAPFAVFLTETNRDWVEPDIMVVCNKDKIHDDGIHGAPDLVVEITSPSTKKKDSGVKLFKYRTEGMREYWIVDPEEESTAFYCFDGECGGAEGERIRFNEEIVSHIYPEFCIRLGDFL